MRKWFSKIGSVFAVVVLPVFAFVAVHGLRTSADIQLNTGDMRVRYFGIPLEYRRMPEPYRSRLLAISAGSKVASDEWRRFQTYPLDPLAFNGARREQLIDITLWADQDPRLARLLFDDLVLDLKGQGSYLPGHLLSPSYIVPDRDGKWRVTDGWRQDPEVMEYLAKKHYAPN